MVEGAVEIEKVAEDREMPWNPNLGGNGVSPAQTLMCTISHTVLLQPFPSRKPLSLRRWPLPQHGQTTQQGRQLRVSVVQGQTQGHCL